MTETIRPFLGRCIKCIVSTDPLETVLIHIGHCPEIPEASLRSPAGDETHHHSTAHSSCSHRASELVWGVPSVLSPTVRQVKFGAALVPLYDVIVSSTTFQDSLTDDKKKTMLAETALRSVNSARAEQELPLLSTILENLDDIDFLNPSAVAIHNAAEIEPAHELAVVFQERATKHTRHSSKLLVAKLNLPLLQTNVLKRSSLRVEPDALSFSTLPTDSPFYVLRLKLPVRVLADQATSSFDWHTMQLSVEMPVDPLDVSPALASFAAQTASSTSLRGAASSSPRAMEPPLIRPHVSSSPRPSTDKALPITLRHPAQATTTTISSGWSEELLVPTKTTRLHGQTVDIYKLEWGDHRMRWHQRLDVIVLVVDIPIISGSSVVAQVSGGALELKFETGEGHRFAAALQFPGRLKVPVDLSASMHNLVVTLRKEENGWWSIGKL